MMLSPSTMELGSILHDNSLIFDTFHIAAVDGISMLPESVTVPGNWATARRSDIATPTISAPLPTFGIALADKVNCSLETIVLVGEVMLTVGAIAEIVTLVLAKPWLPLSSKAIIVKRIAILLRWNVRSHLLRFQKRLSLIVITINT